MKYFKIVVIFAIAMALVGCRGDRVIKDKDLESNYENMTIGNDGINGYTLDMRISGNIDNNSVNEIIRINNYDNRDFQISITNTLSSENNEETYYILGNEKYLLGSDDEVNKIEENIRFENSNVILDVLKNITKKSEPITETIANNQYTLYDVEVLSDVINNILDEGSFGLKTNENIPAKIYIDSDGYVYRIVFSVEELRINATFYGINNSRPVELPEND